MQSYNFQFQSNFEELETLEEKLQSIVGFDSLGDTKQYEMMLVLSEAITNGIEHGNGLDPKKVVHLKAETNESTWVFEVSDEGKGFDPKILENPVEEEYMLRDHGRGWFLMGHYATSISWDETNKCLRITFNI